MITTETITAPPTTDWLKKTELELITEMNEQILSFGKCIPNQFVPMSREEYFTPFSEVFPDRTDVPRFLGQYLMREEYFFINADRPLKDLIFYHKGLNNVTDFHCKTYQDFRLRFHEHTVVSIFKLPPSFFEAVSNYMSIPRVVINNVTRIKETCYQDLLNRNTTVIAEVFVRFHLYVFLQWLESHAA